MPAIMRPVACLTSVALIAFTFPTDAAASRVAAAAETRVSPIRRVINMIQAMQQKVEEEGESEKKLFDKFMCGCKTSQAELKKSIGAANEKVPALKSKVQELGAALGQLKSELKQHRTDRAAAMKAIQEASALRKKENTAFLKETQELRANINAISSALMALKRSGAAGASFVQTEVGQRIKALALEMPEYRSYDQEVLTAFLENRMQTQDLGEIKGILGQMKENMQKDLKKSVATEQSAQASFDQLEGAKGKEASTTTKMIEGKEQRLGDTRVGISDAKHDLKDTTRSLKSDTTLLRKWNVDCAKRVKEHTALAKTRSMEKAALADTVKILNDDDAQALFRKTAAAKPAVLLLQVSSQLGQTAQSKEVLSRLHRLARGHRGQSKLALVALVARVAGRSHKKGFGEVLKMVDEMVRLLSKEQATDNKKKSYCLVETERNGGTRKETQEKIKGLGAQYSNIQDNLGTVMADIATLKAGMQQLDATVASATAQRKSENVVFQGELASNNAALELIELAKNRLAKFYNAKPKAAAALDQQGQQQPDDLVSAAATAVDQQDQQDEQEQKEITAAASSGEEDQTLAASASAALDDEAHISEAAAVGEEEQKPAVPALEAQDASTEVESDGGEEVDLGDVSFVQVRARARMRSEVADESLDESIGALDDSGDGSGDGPKDGADQTEDAKSQADDSQELGLNQVFTDYRKQSGAGSGVISMMDTIKADIKQDVAQLNWVEKDSQKDYENMVKSSKNNREDTVKSITAKQALKASTEAALAKVKASKKQSKKDLLAVDQVLLNLKAECTKLLRAFGQIKKARTDEIENLRKAKAILRGAKFK